jgi:hypothetical protein
LFAKEINITLIVFIHFHRFHITKVKSVYTKHHQRTTNEDESDGGRMYATGSIMCPVQKYKIVSNNTFLRSPCGESGDIYMVW